MTSPELIAYIKKQKELGTPEANYKANLLSQGWNIQDIDEALTVLSEGIPLPPQKINYKDYTLWVKIISSL